MQLTVSVCRGFAAIARQHGGLNLNPEKVEFFNQRLRQRVADRQIADYSAYLAYLKTEAGRAEIPYFVESLTTHTTSFFREPRHYEFLATTGWQTLYDQRSGTERPLLIWSAACSSGAELYSALISATDFAMTKRSGMVLKGVGTDLSNQILNRARQGLFRENEIEGLHDRHRTRYMLRHREDPKLLRIAPELRRLAVWQQLNLTAFGNEGPFDVDVLFIRNVLIYFDQTTQAKVVQSLTRRIRPGGYLFTGHSEALPSVPDGFKVITASIYQKEP